MSQENISQVWIDRFLDFIKKTKKCSTNTYMAYKQDLALYKNFVLTTEDYEDILDFVFFMEDKDLSPRTQARVISSLKTYFRFLQSHQQSVPDDMYFKPPPVKPNHPRSLDLDTFEKLYKVSQNSDVFKAMRNQITLLLLFDLGLRVTQLVNLNLKDFDEEQKSFSIFNKETSKERVLPMSDLLFQEIKSYLAKARPHLNPKQDVQTLILNDRGKRPSRVDIWRWLSAWSKMAGLKETINPHQFRHGCVVALLKSGADLKSIQELLGHSRLDTTKKYESFVSRSKKSKLKEMMKDHHPLSKMHRFSPWHR